jgi:hypothetical protein
MGTLNMFFSELWFCIYKPIKKWGRYRIVCQKWRHYQKSAYGVDWVFKKVYQVVILCSARGFWFTIQKLVLIYVWARGVEVNFRTAFCYQQERF